MPDGCGNPFHDILLPLLCALPFIGAAITWVKARLARWL